MKKYETKNNITLKNQLSDIIIEHCDSYKTRAKFLDESGLQYSSLRDIYNKQNDKFTIDKLINILYRLNYKFYIETFEHSNKTFKYEMSYVLKNALNNDNQLAKNLTKKLKISQADISLMKTYADRKANAKSKSTIDRYLTVLEESKLILKLKIRVDNKLFFSWEY